VTVAVAALCGFPNDVVIIAAEDHMITAGDVEFEQPQPKMWKIGPCCVAMLYGLIAAQGEIALEIELRIKRENVESIGKIAALFGEQQSEYIRREAAIDVLAPLGLSVRDLVDGQSEIGAGHVRDLSKQMQVYYEASGLSAELGGAIILGVDSEGAQIYRVEHGHATFMNTVGFAVAGSGRWHAESQFMFSRYARHWKFPDALSLVYAAKKRAEVAPGVGSETDIVFVTGNPRNVIHARADSDLVIGLEQIYQSHKKKMDEDFAAQHQSVATFFAEFLKKNSSAPAPATAPPEQATPTQKLELPPKG
jgi:hypothetical protein